MICYTIVILLSIVTIIPIAYIVLVSISTSTTVASNSFLSGGSVSLSSYVGIFKYAGFPRAILNSIFLTLVGTGLNMLLTIPAAFALSQKTLPYKKFFMGILLCAMFLRGSLIPSYVWMNNLGLTNTYFAVWCSKLVSIYNILILKTYFEGVPEDLIKTARLFGANDWTVLWKVVLPLSIPAIITVTVFYAVSWWNDYFFTMIYISDIDKLTLPVRIMQMAANVKESSLYSIQDSVYSGFSAVGIRAAGIVVSILPIAIILPFLQKHYIEKLTNTKKERKK